MDLLGPYFVVPQSVTLFAPSPERFGEVRPERFGASETSILASSRLVWIKNTHECHPPACL
jgi:hypothetical protein